jgi:hypothetical protein
MRSALTLALLLAAACGPGRTSAATQPTPAAFDASKSDAQAVALADEVIAAVGGEAAWAQVKQITWQQKVTVDGETRIDSRHSWDRWNGRHRYQLVDRVSKVDRFVAYEIFGDVAWAEIDGATDIPRDRVGELRKEAETRLAIDGYALVMPFKLKDPGVTLKYVEERADESAPETPAVDVIKMTFDKGVGPTSGDVYYVVIEKKTKLIRQVEFVEQGKADDQRIGYKFDNWSDVGGIKLSLKRQNIGYAAEVVEMSDVKIAEPDDELYVQQVK